MLTTDRKPLPTWRGYTNRDLQRCAERELSWRKRVYPNRILTGRMRQISADRELDMMRAIVEHFGELADRERLL